MSQLTIINDLSEPIPLDQIGQLQENTIFEEMGYSLKDTPIKPFQTYRDLTLGASWDKQTGKFIKKLYRLIESQKKQKRFYQGKLIKTKKDILIETFERILTRNYNDQTVFDDLTKRHIEPTQLTHRYDLVTITGMVRCAELITGESIKYFWYYAIGKGTKQPELGDWKLETEVYRVYSKQYGFVSAAGTLIKNSGIFPIGMANADIYENAAVDLPNPSNEQSIMFRTVFTTPIQHEFNRDYITSSHVTQQLSG